MLSLTLVGCRTGGTHGLGEDLCQFCKLERRENVEVLYQAFWIFGWVGLDWYMEGSVCQIVPIFCFHEKRSCFCCCWYKSLVRQMSSRPVKMSTENRTKIKTLIIHINIPYSALGQSTRIVEDGSKYFVKSGLFAELRSSLRPFCHLQYLSHEE